MPRLLGVKAALVLLVLLLLSVSAAAFSVSVPSNVVIQQEGKEIVVSITNDSSESQDFSIEFVAPVDAVISPGAGEIGAHKTRTARISIPAGDGLAGQTYESTLIVEMDNEKIARKINLLFKEAGENGGMPLPFATSGFFSLFTFPTLFTFENILNAVLAIVAAMLLIAFIARFVKRLEASK